MNDKALMVPNDTTLRAAWDNLGKSGWGTNLSATMKRQVAYITVAYGLDPLLDELVVMGGTKLYVCVAGLRRKVQEAGILNGISWDRVKFDDDPKGLIRWKVLLRLKGAEFPFEEFGEAGGPTETNPVAKKHPETMARTRAIGRALRMAAGVSLPIAEEQQEWGMPHSREPRSGVAALSRLAGDIQPAIAESPEDAPTAEPEFSQPGDEDDEAHRIELAAAMLAGMAELNAGQRTAALRAAGATTLPSGWTIAEVAELPASVLAAALKASA